jgi:cyclopropane fatty-acyl-phospholipid synthase-like methyltransferase
VENHVDEMTEQMLYGAGIGAGMRVLDIGCGPGAVWASFKSASRQ